MRWQLPANAAGTSQIDGRVSCEIEVTATAVVAAIRAYSKINAAGQWVDRSEHINLNELFERMTTIELEAYAPEGKLPQWLTPAVGATGTNSQEQGNT